MKAEIDQSGKLEHLNIHTVVALANHISKVVFISSSEKIKLVKTLRKSIVVRKDLIYVIFASMIFLLIKNIKDISILIIDEEYTGKEKFIDEVLNKLYLRHKIKNKPYFTFGRVGKSSLAHNLAINSYRKKRNLKIEIEKLKSNDILRLWRF